VTWAASDGRAAGPWLERLAAVRARLAKLAAADPTPQSLTDADPDTGEQWAWGQVWAHTAEFPGYWLDQIRAALQSTEELPAFGRVRTDPARVGAIESDRTTPVPELWSRIEPQLDRLAQELKAFAPSDWMLRVSHQTLGVLEMPDILERFLVGHLEEHADQLEGLAGS
jgi:hypothetical protein